MPEINKSSPLLWGIIWMLLVSSALVFRPILPVDETRYVSVAWEMWLRESFLVPRLNGDTYSHKPPLLFWLMNAGWKVFGVIEWWPRLVAPIFGLACLYMTAHLGKRLWPDTSAFVVVPLLLIGSIYWGIYTTLTMFDLLVCFWTLIGLNGLLNVKEEHKLLGWMQFSIAIGFGILSKGPVILIFLLPAAVLAPYWMPRQTGWQIWYFGLITSFAGGIILALSWAVPAGWSGGEAYRDAIFWSQSAGRVVNSFAHGKPFWWYFAILPGLVFPWLIWPTFLKCLLRNFLRRNRGGNHQNIGLRLCTIWVVSALLILSAISGKRPHYLLPIFPGLALAAAYIIINIKTRDYVSNRLDVLPAALFSILLGLIAFFAPELGDMINKSQWTDDIFRLWAIPIIIAGVVLILKPLQPGLRRVASITGLNTLIILGAHGLASPILMTAYNVKPVGRYLSELQRNGYTIANFGKYHGQYNFVGRLKYPIAETGQGEVVKWLRQNPNAKIISYYDRFEPIDKPDLARRFRSKTVAIWDRDTILAYPVIARRNSYARRLENDQKN